MRSAGSEIYVTAALHDTGRNVAGRGRGERLWVEGAGGETVRSIALLEKSVSLVFIYLL